MKRLLSLLIVALLTTTNIQAEEKEANIPDWLNYNAFFVANYSFNDFDGQYIPDAAKIIFDVWANHDNFTASVSLDTQYNYLEEAYVSYDFIHGPFNESFYPRFKLGISDAFYGFYSFTDSPITSTMSVLPQGVYAYDFIKGGFAKTNGYSFELIANNLWDSMLFLNFEYSKGTPFIDSYKMYEYSLNNGEETPYVDVEPDQTEAWMLKASWRDLITIFHTEYSQNFHLEKTGNWFIPRDIFSYFYMTDPKWQIDIERTGIQFLIDKWEFTYEYYELDVLNDTHDVPGSFGGYFTVQGYYDWGTATVGVSKAEPDAPGSFVSEEYFVGVMVPFEKKHSIGVEYHHGKGSAWIIEGPERPEDWQSLIVSYAYKF